MPERRSHPEQRAVRDGVAGAVLIGVLDLMGGLTYVDPAAPFIEDGFISDFWWLLIHVSIYLGLAYGLWKRSRAAAIGLVGWQLCATPWPWWVYEGEGPSWFWFWVALVLVALFVRAARATFAIKKLSGRPQAPPATGKPSTGRSDDS
jgi:hypothetical protein